jgi:hypothetical protein
VWHLIVYVLKAKGDSEWNHLIVDFEC